MRRKIVTFGLLCAAACGTSLAQQSIGSVGIADATVAGVLEVSNGRAVLLGASTVTARDHTADVALNRGGHVRVCATSGLHLTAGKSPIDAPFLLALDRGAIEIATRATTSDVVMTPDLRFTLKSAGQLDLHLRVARNGDTCVENRGAAAPILSVADQFGESSYELHAGQHVLFEHGSLKEVVDNEREPCGCPAEPVVSVAAAGATGGTPAAPGAIVSTETSATPNTAAEQHPFPAAVSAGLTPPSAPPQAPTGVVHAQVSTTMSYGEGSSNIATGDTDSGGAAGSARKSASPSNTVANSTTEAPASAQPASPAAATVKAEAPPPAPAPPPADVFHAIGRFFKKLFGSH